MTALVTFRVGASRFAVPAEFVAEVVETGPISHRVPGGGGGRGPGLVCVRGRWIPVVDLARAAPEVAPHEVGAVETSPSGSLTMLVLGLGRRRLGLRVDGLGEIVPAPQPGDALADAAGDLLEVHGEMVRCVDPGSLLGSGASALKDRSAAMDEERATVETVRVISFRVCGEDFGVDVMRVLEVVRVPEIRRVPRAPEFVEGVVSLRDSVVPVIDMRKRFSLPARPEGGAARLLVAAAAGTQVALIVDEVPDVVDLSRDQINVAPEFFRGLAGRYLEGTARDGGRLLILLNLDEILSARERIALRRFEKTLDSPDSLAGENPGEGAAPPRRAGARRKRRRAS
jgi:purine-binding chemotaxis protein CheW